MSQFSIETGSGPNGPWEIRDVLESPRLVPVLKEAQQYREGLTYVRVVRDDNEAEATVLAPKRS